MNSIDLFKQQATATEEMARKVWLAGLGAYGKGFEQAKATLETLNTDSNALFAELVAKGEKLEADGIVKFTEAKDKVTAKTDVNGRMETLRTTFGMNTADEDQKIEALSAKVDALTEAVAKLAAK